MANVFVNIPGNSCRCVRTTYESTVETVCRGFLQQFDRNDFYIINNGKLVQPGKSVNDGDVYHLFPRVLGGKGGFGSMLRALGAQIEKTTNREACRDLSGRRMRDVNNEQKLREWVAKASDREREKDQKRKERMERRKAQPKHNFDDPDYMKQKMQVTEDLEDAIHQGLKKSSTASATCTQENSRKRKSEEAGPSKPKRAAAEWLGIDLHESDLSDSDTDDAVPGPSHYAVPGSSSPGPSCPVPDSGAGSGTSGSGSEHEEQSDSGVESVDAVKIKSASPMEVDSDSSAKDSAMNSDVDIMGNKSASREAPPVDASEAQGAVGGVKDVNKLGLLAALDEHKPKTDSVPLPVEAKEVDLMDYADLSSLELLGLENLKAILMFKSMKCGGTLQERAERLWSVRGLTKDQIHPSLLAKPSKGKGKKS